MIITVFLIIVIPELTPMVIMVPFLHLSSTSANKYIDLVLFVLDYIAITRIQIITINLTSLV